MLGSVLGRLRTLNYLNVTPALRSRHHYFDLLQTRNEGSEIGQDHTVSEKGTQTVPKGSWASELLLRRRAGANGNAFAHGFHSMAILFFGKMPR